MIDFEIHRILRREFGLGIEDIRALDLDLAVEWGLLPAPRAHSGFEQAQPEHACEASAQR